MRRLIPACPECDSTAVIPMPGEDELYRCQGCGAYFEGDGAAMEVIADRRQRSQVRQARAAAKRRDD